MTEVTVNNNHLTIVFPGWERLMAGRRFHSVPLDAIRTSEVTGWPSEFLGLRSGLNISGYRKLGTYRHPNGTRRLVAMKAGEPVLRIRLTDGSNGWGFDELLISTPNADEVNAALQD
ncbi:hypothetical protein [Brevibacterium aurantiacum]|uniref:Bacterial Pleckstrin homology domain-containing protein n=1 Tax=Brevibacterium aurantiacum TaxID=273384 RepID=A0A556CPT1_BREAU|nr:hypothetical protein [Brevibacterium aurantiacum]TSI19423.1 hypothetical protein FO013_00130 [Brevibacterium aurantiacum]